MFNIFQPKFKLAKGVTVANLEGISEGYSQQIIDPGKFVITVNVSAERLADIYLGLCSLIKTHSFAFVQIPTNEKDEIKIRQSPQDPFHDDLYYLDGLTYEVYQTIFQKFAGFFVDDGQITFGFGSHTEYDEVFVGRYKVVTIYADDPAKYVHYLEAQRFPRRDPLRTVFDNLSEKTPGATHSIKINGKSIYDLIEVLQKGGFYFAERIPFQRSSN